MKFLSTAKFFTDQPLVLFSALRVDSCSPKNRYFQGQFVHLGGFKLTNLTILRVIKSFSELLKGFKEFFTECLGIFFNDL